LSQPKIRRDPDAPLSSPVTQRSKGDGAYEAAVEAVQQLERERTEGTLVLLTDRRGLADVLVEEIAQCNIRYKTCEYY
jgi:hypothetical protein